MLKNGKNKPRVNCLDFDHFKKQCWRIIHQHFCHQNDFLYFVIFKSKTDKTFSCVYYLKYHKYVKMNLFLLKNMLYLLKVDEARLREEIEKPCCLVCGSSAAP